MRRVNIANPPFQDDPDDPDGFRAAMFRFGRDVGAKATGMSVYERGGLLPRGERLARGVDNGPDSRILNQSVYQPSR
jgi:hypothetical protein